jgi:RimJ/RimL family protein N-acetyltransferase
VHDTDGPPGQPADPVPVTVGTGTPPPPTYPTALVCDVVTARGARLHVRPIRTTDSAALAEFHHGLSDRSVYRRFFFVHPTLSDAEVEHFTHIDYADRLALVAEDGGRIVAVGRYERTPGTDRAEVAFVVNDSYQNLGIATVLLHQLARAALALGITTFTAETLAENRGMLAVFRHSGFPVTATTEFDTVCLQFPIGAVTDGTPPPG